MDDLKALYELCKNIDLACREQIEKGIKILTAIERTSEQHVKKISTAKPMLNKSAYTDIIAGVVSDTIKDAQTIKQQLPIFTKAFVDIVRIEDVVGCDILSEVWCGDAYGTRGVQALRDLLADIKTQTKEFTVDNVIKKCCI